jgi:hypothetical protein
MIRLPAGLPAPEFETIPDFVSLTILFKEQLQPHFSIERRPNDSINGIAIVIFRLISTECVKQAESIGFIIDDINKVRKDHFRKVTKMVQILLFGRFTSF